MLYIVAAYVLLCLGLFIFQRALIYHPSKFSGRERALEGLPAGLVRNFSLESADGIRVGLWHVLPAPGSTQPEVSAGHEPALNQGDVVLFFHGNAGHRGHRTDLLFTLARMGCHAVALDYRGYGDSDGKPGEAGLALDARCAWNWLVQTQGVAPGRIVLHGESMGAAVALRLATELCVEGTPPRGVVLESTFSSLADAAQSIYWFIPVRLILRERYASIERIGNLTCPLLAFHGTRDQVVPLALGKRLFDAAPAHSADGTQKRFVEIPEAGHNDLREIGAKIHEQELRAFVKR